MSWETDALWVGGTVSLSLSEKSRNRRTGHGKCTRTERLLVREKRSENGTERRGEREKVLREKVPHEQK